ncbi:hypothetical protein G9A89_005681 [Geosiphon pyriformis]|nr:hypothetical protein G9A89_005681 [Geosiphon pyriformis]
MLTIGGLRKNRTRLEKSVSIQRRSVSLLWWGLLFCALIFQLIVIPSCNAATIEKTKPHNHRNHKVIDEKSTEDRKLVTKLGKPTHISIQRKKASNHVQEHKSSKTKSHQPEHKKKLQLNTTKNDREIPEKKSSASKSSSSSTENKTAKTINETIPTSVINEPLPTESMSTLTSSTPTATATPISDSTGGFSDTKDNGKEDSTNIPGRSIKVTSAAPYVTVGVIGIFGAFLPTSAYIIAKRMRMTKKSKQTKLDEFAEYNQDAMVLP